MVIISLELIWVAKLYFNDLITAILKKSFSEGAEYFSINAAKVWRYGVRFWKAWESKMPNSLMSFFISGLFWVNLDSRERRIRKSSLSEWILLKKEGGRGRMRKEGGGRREEGRSIIRLLWFHSF